MAVILAASIGAGSAFAQEPAVPATTTSEQPDGQSKGKDGEAKPKAEKPKVDAPDVAPPPATNTDAAAPELAKSGKPKDDEAKPEKPKPEKAKPEKGKPAPATPQSEMPKQEQPKPAKAAKPTPKPKPTEPKGAAAAAASAQADGPAPASQASGATRAAPRPRAAQRVPASSTGDGATREQPAPRHSRRVAGRPQETRRPAGPVGLERSAGSVRDPAAAAPATGHAVRQTPMLAARAASDDVAPASAPLDRGPPSVLIVDAREPGNAMLLLAIALTAAVAFLLGREARRGPAGVPRSRRMPRSPPSGDG